MRHTKPNTQKQHQKSSIAARARNINILILAVALALVTATATVIVMDIDSEVSKNLARSYSVEAAKEFYTYISQDLVLVRKASRSNAVTTWFVDEGNQAKRNTAYNEMMDYIGMLQSAHLYFGVNATWNEYSIESGATLADFVPFDKFSPSNPQDSWYFDCIDSEHEYALHIDVDKFTHRWNLWINHKVMADGELVGVFASGLQIRALLHALFGKYNAKNVKGYVVDRQGVIQLDSVFSELYAPAGKRRIHEESPDPAFAWTIDAYLKRIDGFFGHQAQPETVKLAQGAYRHASIAPITGSDWSVVIFCNNDSLFGIRHFLPLSIVLLSSLCLYAAARNAMMRRLIFTPLNRLTQSVAEAEAGVVDIFGSDRDDEIGELARTIREMRNRLSAYNAELLHSTHERQRQTRLLHAVNNAAAALLTTADEKNFEASLLEAMELMGRCIDVDHVSIWRNETIDDALHYVLEHAWLSDIARHGKALPNNTKLPYGDNPEWESKLLRGECIRGPLIALSRDEQALLRPYGIRSVLIIPMHLQERFWGFVRFDDCHRDRAFTEDEVNILRTASLMMVSAVHRNVQATAHTKPITGSRPD